VHQPAHDSDSLPVIVFVTVNTDQRRPILANPTASRCIVDSWKEAEAWLVGRYVILPDHLHFFCSPADPTVTLKRWVKYWKTIASRRWPRREEQPIWQKDFWDTQLRRDEGYMEKWSYVLQNPVRKGLVAVPEDWPYAGELNVLPWDSP
jgi:REP element-mobilizing transposase RayT